MKFVIERRGLKGTPFYRWELVRTDGTGVCGSVNDLQNEREARSDIAKAKTAMKGVRFAKVETAE